MSSSHSHAHAGHDHDHSHAHDHHEPHDHAAHASHNRLAWALGITVVAMVIGIAGGVISGSLALIADAGHMLADAGSLALSLLAARQALKTADAGHSFGHARMPVLAAFVNGTLLLLASGWITFEAVQRFIVPAPVDGHTMALIAVVGLVANVVSLALLHGGDAEDLNRRGAAAHVLSDLLGSVAAIIAALIILNTGWLTADPLLSLVAAGLVLRMGIKIVRESAHILLEGTPRGLSLERIAAELPQRVEGVESVHHLHAWSLSQTRKLMTLHVTPDGRVATPELIARVREALAHYGITHVTVQVETGPCADADCGSADGH